MEEALHDTPLYREFALLDAGNTRLPDESTILRFRHLLETHQLAPQILATVNTLLTKQGLLLKSGTAVDATLIAAPSSTINSTGKRDSDRHQTQKGGNGYFGMSHRDSLGQDPYRRRCQLGFGAYRCHHTCQCSRHDSDNRSTAWKRDRCLW